ncbi:hypothetical protein GN277_11835 [Lachnospiraceae bacterium WCA-9-b2]|uniref:Type I restriction modification DNA specificity domain-containing protein n=1 Tax=Sporofaciens musculi TaxID=2681861 RepID=A0A7X3MGY6_9FIRM|nr:hypothetical protein [Sporofaciens musculi]MCI9422974.1 hypothetical protein [Dorea sp.]MXP76052.1 hypothetical protein [Sporofaciens musculi]
MAICVIKKTTHLGPLFVLTPERYNPKRHMNLPDENNGVLLSEIITLENDIVTSKKNSSDWHQINTSDAMSGYLRIPSKPGKLNSNKKILKHGDVIISRLRPYLRQVAYVDIDTDEPICASTEFYILRARNHESIAFLVPFLLSKAVQIVFANSVEGSQHPRFKENDLLNLVVPSQLFEEREKISQDIEKAITRYREYEKSLEATIRHVNNIMPI